jgi:hypothetical protein
MEIEGERLGVHTRMRAGGQRVERWEDLWFLETAEGGDGNAKRPGAPVGGARFSVWAVLRLAGWPMLGLAGWESSLKKIFFYYFFLFVLKPFATFI